MGKTLKIIIVMAVVFSLVIFAVLGVYLKEDMDYNMRDLNNKLLIMDKKKEYLTEQTMNLQSVKTGLINDMAKESDKTQQEELQKQLISLNEQQKLAAQQRIAQEQARLDALRQQQIQQAQLQAAQAATTVKKSSSSTSTKSSTTTPKPAATPKPKPAPKPAPVKTKAS